MTWDQPQPRNRTVFNAPCWAPHEALGCWIVGKWEEIQKEGVIRVASSDRAEGQQHFNQQRGWPSVSQMPLALPTLAKQENKNKVDVFFLGLEISKWQDLNSKLVFKDPNPLMFSLCHPLLVCSFSLPMDCPHHSTQSRKRMPYTETGDLCSRPTSAIY